MTFEKIVKLCEKHGFLRRIANPRLEMFKIGPTGALLQENLHTEWLNNIVISKDIQMFHCVDDFAATFDFAKATCLGIPPFGISRVTQRKLRVQEQLDKTGFEKYFDQGRIYECCVFMPPKDVTQFFHQWQRERKIWWRRFSSSPGRYILTEGTQNVEILAKYPWGDQLVESLSVVSKIEGLTSGQLQVQEGKKLVEMHCVVSKISSVTMLLNTICDAYEEPLFQEKERPLFRFHRKLAPYKISFSVPSGTKAVTNELKDLAVYLCRQLRKNHISCLYLPSSYKNTLDFQWKQYDQLGVPYNVLLNEKTLKNGIVFLRSRDTTLKEQVHVADLAPYVEKLFKNY
ncbi:DNA polymerase subunit gamma-2, mitochondrial [Tribolium castaneum]|nr:PREDICTED: DNA polymerase subunit gamma-2, mitochondrial [Tribolium castaneum]|eukprot:XP_008196614.1 PREDICTED: DNA polymerase subunit gamma-2, mitochondrial [Tribolium castaneum]